MTERHRQTHSVEVMCSVKLQARDNIKTSGLKSIAITCRMYTVWFYPY